MGYVTWKKSKFTVLAQMTNSSGPSGSVQMDMTKNPRIICRFFYVLSNVTRPKSVQNSKSPFWMLNGRKRTSWASPSNHEILPNQKVNLRIEKGLQFCAGRSVGPQKIHTPRLPVGWAKWASSRWSTYHFLRNLCHCGYGQSQSSQLSSKIIINFLGERNRPKQCDAISWYPMWAFWWHGNPIWERLIRWFHSLLHQ
jgi:hypothetical protein